MSIQLLLKELREKVHSILGDKLKEVILYGSYARGDYSTESDVDVLLIVKERLSLEEYEKIMEVIAELSLKYEKVISIIDYPENIFMTSDSPFLQNVKKEGIKIE
ncbi:nucleotidyltransferase family protein [Thermococcus alcaliphilus]|uniref:nucleotidyltransferase family protein n=1 Tax=Thermococcus alcaliphilus TaxID=139207 RepID=UPI00209169EC|nr:nucleotidyltransferase domain-containing protein [Thermococcus alcaliphilus]MCO6041875.1 nucleotidyltransferase domain-containing protein [Thermococcus alcaliphilus]